EGRGRARSRLLHGSGGASRGGMGGRGPRALVSSPHREVFHVAVGVMAGLRDIFQRASWTPPPPDTAERELLAVEQRIGSKLPATFRELHASADGSAFLARFSNADSPIAPNELGVPLRRWSHYDPLQEGILAFMIENQAVCAWGIRLDAGDDPPVVVE